MMKKKPLRTLKYIMLTHGIVLGRGTPSTVAKIELLHRASSFEEIPYSHALFNNHAIMLTIFSFQLHH